MKIIKEYVLCEYCNKMTEIDNPEVTHREAAEPIWICPEHTKALANDEL